ncbi:hypothetical protein [Pseudomonas syringae group sp. J248-6]|uniref:hypothetical protein n=1 Tax=Pseudomonas syringae group sp. J248-6 TaxID=3079590 RepID=UPI002909306B|nr:hypothetical protein [Pseudomonas syringae group sp. J248-6]MDU8542518.1 hypothetical protein [Pseudomonas syringae group sp. J248-6]
MNDLEEEMRRALFGNADALTKPDALPAMDAGIDLPVQAKAKAKAPRPVAPRLRVTLRVGNEYEGQTYELLHDANTLSTLLADQEAVKAARKKYRFVEVVSVKTA